MAKKYTDADRLYAEIKRLKDEYTDIAIDSHYGTVNANHVVDDLEQLLSLIDSLQQEQPCEDFEVRKQIEELANDWHHKGFASDEDCPLCMQDLMDILWHFYELGKQSKEPVSDDLEEEIKRYEASLPESATVDPFEGHPTLEDVARHFANWGAEHTKKEIPVSEGLEEAAREYNKYSCNKAIREGVFPECPPVYIIDAFKAGAEWQKERSKKPFTDEFMKKVISIWKTRANGDISQLVQFSFDETIALLRAGAERQKQQMLKDAVEGYVNYYEDGGGILMAEAQVGCPYHNGDKVKIIIVKEDKK